MTVGKRHGFECTKCGLCCQGLRIPLSLDEASRWVKRGHTLEVIVRGGFPPSSAYAPDSSDAYMMDRSFQVIAGKKILSVQATLVGTFHGRCPNLMEDNRCSIYEERPMTCRIYPAGLNPFLAFKTSDRRCPPEAWGEQHETFLSSNGAYPKPLTDLIHAARAATLREVKSLERLCAALSVNNCALIAEGFVAYKISRDDFLHALQNTQAAPDKPDDNDHAAYGVLSNQKQTIETLATLGIKGTRIARNETPLHGDSRMTYLGFHEDS